MPQIFDFICRQKTDFLSPSFSLSPPIFLQLVVKKIYAWWLYKNKNNFDMSTHWWLRFCAGGALLLVIFYLIFSPSLPSFRSTGSSPAEGLNTQLEEIKLPNYSNVTNSRNDSDSDGDFSNIDDVGDDNLSAFVIPIKVHNISLNEEDLLYESKRQGEASSSSQRGKLARQHIGYSD